MSKRFWPVIIVVMSTGYLCFHSAAAIEILNDGSYWRYHVMLRQPVVQDKDSSLTGGTGVSGRILKVHVDYRSYPGLEQLETPAPPTNWISPEFDDAAWPREKMSSSGAGSIRQIMRSPGLEFLVGQLCVRGRFAVTDPEAVAALRLSLKYRGGVVVYLNGKEIARQHLPAGNLGARIPAESYPPEAYVDAAGRLHSRETPEVAAVRNRSLGPVEIPRTLLRQGVNVLAVAVHRSDYPVVALQQQFMKIGWPPIDLGEVRLEAEGQGVLANTGRPEGVQVWNQDLNDRVNVFSWGDPNEPLRPVEIVAARNGVFSGQVVIGGTRALRGPRTRTTDLKTVDGNGVIPAANIQVRWGRLDGKAYHVADWFDGLAENPPEEVPLHPAARAAVQPVWITVRVPETAKPGIYEGSVVLEMEALAAVTVRVRVSVADFVLPNPRDFRTYVGLYQSPTTLAMHYGVPEWSEGHWKLMEKSFRLLAQVGNKLVNVPLVDRTQLGNDEGMVFWVRNPDGSFSHDFSVLDRYLELVARCVGPQDFVALHVWHSGGWEMRQPDQKNTVTVIDRKTGVREHMQVPVFGTEESKLFWKPVLDAIRQRLEKMGMARAMCLGILSDGTAPVEVFRAFEDIAPGIGWTRGCHSSTRALEPYFLYKGSIGKVVCHEFCYGMAMADPAQGLPAIWKQRAGPGVAFIRHNFDDTLSLLKYRTFAERSLFCGTRGVGRTGLDYWDVLADKDGRKRQNLFNRFPESSCAQRAPNMFRLSWPGPNGAEPTVRFQQFLEGLQASEALIVVAEAQGEYAEKIGAELAAKCRQVYLDRLNYAREHCPEAYGEIYFGTNHLGWQELDARLFAVAAEVQKKLRGKF